jgi:hypothetical protein
VLLTAGVTGGERAGLCCCGAEAGW